MLELKLEDPEADLESLEINSSLLSYGIVFERLSRQTGGRVGGVRHEPELVYTQLKEAYGALLRQIAEYEQRYRSGEYDNIRLRNLKENWNNFPLIPPANTDCLNNFSGRLKHKAL